MDRTKRLTTAVLAAAILAPLSTPAMPEMRLYGPFHGGSPDSGTCGNSWADDAFDRMFRVDTTALPDGRFLVSEQFLRGTFTTHAGASPGGCETNPGGTVADGVTGRMQGSFVMRVSGRFDPNARCTPESCGTTAGFVETIFGPGATFEIPTFDFGYEAGPNGHWRNASADRGGNHGDITGAP